MTLPTSDLATSPRAARSRALAAAFALGALLTFVGPVTIAGEAADPVEASAGIGAAASTPTVRLLSQEQYFNSVGYLFGADIAVQTHFAPFRRTDGLLGIGAGSAGVTAGQLDEFQRTATAIATQVVSPEHRAFLIPCRPANLTAGDRNCARSFIRRVGTNLYRRPMERSREDALVEEAFKSASHLKSFHDGLGLTLAGMLMSPEFLFVIDRPEPDPARPGAYRLDGYSLASRLSLFLWNSGPDDELLAAAGRGELHSSDGRARQVERMLASPRLETGVRAFFDDLFGFDDFGNLSKDARIYPAFTGVTVQDAREQTLRTVVDQLLVKQADYRDLYTSHDTFISPAIAAILQVPASPGWTPYRTPEDSQRVGLLTQISFLAAHSHPGRSSPTRRGKALRELLLCQTVPRPPPNVDFSIVENPKSTLRTARERLTAHRSNPICAGCHKITDPIGLALENFDGAGQYRESEKGAAIDASGALDGKTYTNATGLGQALHDHPALTSCLVKRTYSYAVGTALPGNDKSVLPDLAAEFAQSGYRFPALLRTIALSVPFSRVRPAPAAAAPPAPPVPATTTARIEPGQTAGTSR